MNARFNEVNYRIGSLESRVDRIERQTDSRKKGEARREEGEEGDEMMEGQQPVVEMGVRRKHRTLILVAAAILLTLAGFWFFLFGRYSYGKYREYHYLPRGGEPVFRNADFCKKPLERRFFRKVYRGYNEYTLKTDRLTGEVYRLAPAGVWVLIGIEIPKEYVLVPAQENTFDALIPQYEYSDDKLTWDSNAKASVELCEKPVPASVESQQSSNEAKGGVAPQVSKGEAKKLAEVARQSRANLLSASSAYRESLEKLIELQRQDESRAAEVVGKRKELRALGVIEQREVEEGERALAEVQGKISETMKRIAEVDQLVTEVNAAENYLKSRERGAKKGAAK
jgi:hypothetical protein